MGGILLTSVYKNCMAKVIYLIVQHKDGVLGVDGAANRLSKSVSNVILNIPQPRFIDYLGAGLGRETASNVTIKIKECVDRLN